MEMSAELANLLDQKVFGHVTTQNRSGSPQITIVWMDVRNGKPSFNTARGRLKARNLERNPKTWVSIQSATNPREYAVLVGAATLIDEGADEQMDRLSNKYLGRDYRAPAGEVRVTVEISLEELHGRGPWMT